MRFDRACAVTLCEPYNAPFKPCQTELQRTKDVTRVTELEQRVRTHCASVIPLAAPLSHHTQHTQHNTQYSIQLREREEAMVDMDEDVAAKEEEIKRLQAKLTEASVALLHANEITMEKVDEAREEERTRVEQLELRVTKKDKTIQVYKPAHTHAPQQQDTHTIWCTTSVPSQPLR